MDSLQITRNDSSQRFEARLDGRIASIATFVDEGSRRLFPHTSTLQGFGGRGIATALVVHALRETINEGKTIVPHCSFVQRIAEQEEFISHLA